MNSNHTLPYLSRQKNKKPKKNNSSNAPLASHAHNTLLLDLEQLEVMASLNDKINVDSSSYFPALRSTRNVANTVQHQQHSATTTATTITTSTTPLLLPSPTVVPQPPQPPPRTPPPLPPQPPLSSPSPTTKQLSSLLPLPPTMHTQTYHQPYNNNHKTNNDLQHQQTTKPRCANSRDTVGPGGVGNQSSTTTHSADRSATLLFFAGSPNDDDDGDDDRDLLISAVAPLIPSATTTTTTTDTDAFDAICTAALPSCSSAANDMQPLIGFDDDVRSRDRPQTFDDYLDLSKLSLSIRCPSLMSWFSFWFVLFWFSITFVFGFYLSPPPPAWKLIQPFRNRNIFVINSLPYIRSTACLCFMLCMHFKGS